MLTSSALLSTLSLAGAAMGLSDWPSPGHMRRSTPLSAELADLRNPPTTPAYGWNSSLLDPPSRRPGRPPRVPPSDPNGCPPCFNCLIPAFHCGNSGSCNAYDGSCRCPPGFGGQDCLTPLCGALTDGDERFPRPEGELCECKDGWGGINCNVCKEDKVCKGFRPKLPDGSDAGGGGGGWGPGDGGSGNGNDADPEMVCYKGGLAVIENFQMCDVTNRKIIDTIPDNKPPQVTFSCAASASTNATSLMPGYETLFRPDAPLDNPAEALGTCNFQFWVDRIESFYCKLDGCSWALSDDAASNGTNYRCEKIQCSCVPGRFLCGEEGSINIDDFLTESVTGPGSFSCTAGKGCAFSEPAMNSLINDVFGDKSITLDCESGECLPKSLVPGYKTPEPKDNSKLVAISAAAAGLIFILACIGLWYMGRVSRQADAMRGVQLPEDEASKLMTDHVPATVHFSNLSYTLPSGKQVLSHVTGSVRPGEMLAIMGASGAGKSTLLDILARKAKRGIVDGDMWVNSNATPDETFRRVTGYVDQEDTLLSTLTVYETVLLSALLRLPKDMSYEAKVYRTLEVLNELGILGIRDSRIGESGRRSISGGEKRRVSIACELVTGPSILFLDEPTSGLDSYNAQNVVASLRHLAKTYNRTVIFTIHQPQSSIVSLFDRLLVLAKGQTVYMGQAKNAAAHFERIGHPCPKGWNLADWVIDLTVDAAGDAKTNGSQVNGNDSSLTRRPLAEQIDEENDEEEREEEVQTPLLGQISSKAKKILGLKASRSSFSSRSSGSATPDVPEKLASLILANRGSDDTKIIEAEINRIQSGSTPNGIESSGRDIGEETEVRGFKKANGWTQFRLLSGRAFKNLYRNPLLMGTHYAMAIVVALLCGGFFYHVTNDIAGFQNRLGLFLFILSLFGFSTLSSMGIFAAERVLFMRERANGYYSAGAYFASKVLFDVIPLRVVPPFVLGSIVYGLAGLNAEVSSFWKFIMTLVLFNLTSSSVVLFLSLAVSDVGVASLLGSLVMLYNLLFAGLFMNYNRVPDGLKWMETLSFFHAGYEALLVNELRYLQLNERKFGLDIQVPSATILSSFGFNAQAFWWPDTGLLGIVFGIFTFLSYLVLEFIVKERR